MDRLIDTVLGSLSPESDRDRWSFGGFAVDAHSLDLAGSEI